MVRGSWGGRFQAAKHTISHKRRQVYSSKHQVSGAAVDGEKTSSNKPVKVSSFYPTYFLSDVMDPLGSERHIHQHVSFRLQVLSLGKVKDTSAISAALSGNRRIDAAGKLDTSNGNVNVDVGSLDDDDDDDDDDHYYDDHDDVVHDGDRDTRHHQA